MSANGCLQRLTSAIAQVNEVIVGKPEAVDSAFACLLSGGHLLIEDIPGVGKTTLAHALAICLGSSWQRIQFTSDLLPADILGVSIYQRHSETFEFHPGPVFNQLILADEINRGTPKTQSALLEAMAEKHVTVDGVTRPLPLPFFVIATQNPLDNAGTFPLPDSQLDRFLLCIKLGYPGPLDERALLTGQSRQSMLKTLKAILEPDDLNELQQRINEIHHAEALLDYIQNLILASRQWPGLRQGLSPRAGLALLRCSSAIAMLAGRDYCLPEDVQRVFPDLCRHRLQVLNNSQTGQSVSGLESARQILRSVAVLDTSYKLR